MLFLVALLVFGSVSAGAWEVLRPKENVVGRRLGLDAPAAAGPASALVPGAARRGLLGRVSGGLGSLLARVLPGNFVRQIDRMLVMANAPWSLPGFLATCAFSVVTGLVLLTYVITSIDGITSTQIFTYTILIVPFSVLIPYALLRRRVKTRQKLLIRGLPDGIDLLVTCIEAGIGVDSAFAMVTEKSEGPLAETFALYLRQVGLGRPRREALNYVAQRSGVPDLLSLAAAVAQAEDLGTTLGDVLRVQAEELRLARRQRAQTAAQRAPVLMTIPLALCFLPAMGAVIVVPSILNLINFAGHLGGR